MATAATIIQQIENTVQGAYSDWQIGLTDDSATRKAQLGNPLSWLQWQADSIQAAMDIVAYFKKLGMYVVTGKHRPGETVYILLSDRLII